MNGTKRSASEVDGVKRLSTFAPMVVVELNRADNQDETEAKRNGTTAHPRLVVHPRSKVLDACAKECVGGSDHE